MDNNSKQLQYTHTLSTTDSPTPSSSMNSKDNSQDEEKSFEVVTDGVRQSTVAFEHQPHLVRRGLTEVSAMFDRNGKGYLDDTERALRRMDSQDKGFLGIDKVCVIFESLQAEQERSSELLEALRDEGKKSMNLKMGVIALTCFTVLLALANVGTSFAIAQLVKDMEVSNGDLAGTADGMRVGTTSKLVSFEMESLDETRRRRLALDSTLLCESMVDKLGDGSTEKSCQLQGVMKLNTVTALHRQLKDVDFVQLVCNNKRSQIAGGIYLDGTPSIPEGAPFKVFPDGVDTNAKYQAVQNVQVPAQAANVNQGIVGKPARRCDANFQLAMYCPTALVNGKQQECMVMTAFQPTIECPTNPVICGPKPQSGTFIV